MIFGGKRSSCLTSGVLSILVICFNNEFSALAMQLPYGGVAKALMQNSEHGAPHPFMSRFTDRGAPVSGYENPAQKSKLLNRLRRKNLQLESHPKNRFHGQRKSDVPAYLADAKDDIEGMMAVQDLAVIDRMLEEELNYAQQLANGIIVDLKTILGDMRKGEAEFADGVNPELRSTIEKAIEVPDQERLLRLS